MTSSSNSARVCRRPINHEMKASMRATLRCGPINRQPSAASALCRAAGARRDAAVGGPPARGRTPADRGPRRRQHRRGRRAFDLPRPCRRAAPSTRAYVGSSPWTRGSDHHRSLDQRLHKAGFRCTRAMVFARLYPAQPLHSRLARGASWLRRESTEGQVL